MCKSCQKCGEDLKEVMNSGKKVVVPYSLFREDVMFETHYICPYCQCFEYIDMKHIERRLNSSAYVFVAFTIILFNFLLYYLTRV